MLRINKLRADHVIDFAAEELKKYLRMLMPRCGEIDICYAPDAADGFRLGLMEDFGLPCEAQDPVLDDVIHVDTQAEGGILAGSNLRSILFAVYRFLRLNGCRWLYPGVDGEHIPMISNLTPQYYHKLADHRFRGHCNEGAESQTCMLETIDFYAKLELNVYMLEFDNPYYYYDEYYSHVHNTANRPAEPVTYEQTLQWKRQCEAEIAKRGLQFHDMGHGWTAEPFGLCSTEGWHSDEEAELTEDQRQCLAQLNGVRGLNGGVALNTNLCMSNPTVRSRMVKGVVEYAEKARNVDYLHVWLADNQKNHCECPKCQKMRPSDFYMMIMNELDEALTAKGLATRIVFISYLDTLYGPEHVFIKNPQRFSLLYAPIQRSYTSSISENTKLDAPKPYIRNNWTRVKTAEENLALLRQWQENWHGPGFSYEYHFWRAQYNDPGLMAITRRIYEDIRGLRFMRLDGFVEDGSQRSFFPNGLHMYMFAEALMDRECDYDAVVADYLSHIYGPDWQQVKAYLEAVTEAFHFPFMCGETSVDKTRGSYYNPNMANRLGGVAELAKQGVVLAKNHRIMPTRPQTVSYRLLERHAEYITLLAEVMSHKALGQQLTAVEKGEAFADTFGRHEFEIERYYDHDLAVNVMFFKVGKRPAVDQGGW